MMPDEEVRIAREVADDALRRLAQVAGSLATYCDHAEHLEEADRTAIAASGAALRELSLELARSVGASAVDLYSVRLGQIERRHPLFPAGGFDGGAAAAAAKTWRDLQTVQSEHDRHYHPDVTGLSRYEQLRHYTFHVAKIAGAIADVIGTGGTDADDFIRRRIPDTLLFGIKLATLMNESLPQQPTRNGY